MVAGTGIKAEIEPQVGGVYRLSARMRVKGMSSSLSWDRDFTFMAGALIQLTGRNSSGVWEIRILYPHAEDTGAYKLSAAEYFNPDIRYHVGSYDELFRVPNIPAAILQDASPSKSKPLDRDFAYWLAVERLKYSLHHYKHFAQIHVSDFEHSKIIVTNRIYIVYLYFESVNQLDDTVYFRHEQRVWYRSDVDLMKQSVSTFPKWNCGWEWEEEIFTKSPVTGEWQKGYILNPKDL